MAAAQDPPQAAEDVYAAWLAAGREELQAAADAYGAAPSPEAARRATAAIQDALTRHYARLGPRLRRDADFASMTRLYGTDLREPALKAATTAIELGREKDDLAGVAVLSAWMRDALLSGRAERTALETALAVPHASAGGGSDGSGEAAPPPAAGAFRWARRGAALACGTRSENSCPSGASAANPRAGSAAPSGAAEPGDVAKPPTSLEGWVRVDDPRAFGEAWREALGWAPKGTPGWDLLDGLYALFIKPSATGGIADALGGPVYLASGVWATEAGRAALRALSDGDVACARLVESSRTTGESTTCRQDQRVETTQGAQTVSESESCAPTAAAEIPATCRSSSVMDVYARPICDHYDGRGSVFLAECDCVKQMQLPSVMLLKSVCDAEAGKPGSGVTAAGCERMVEKGSEKLQAWPVANVKALTAPVLANALMRYGVRSQRRLSGMQGTYAGCVYPPCASMLSRDAYTDARITRMERDRCPAIRCEASINVDWVGGDVNIEGNMLKVRCFGGECIRPDGSPKCQNDGRCMQDGKCVCEPGFRGERCEEVVPGEGSGSAATTTGTGGTSTAAQIAGPLAQETLGAARDSFGVDDLLSEPRLIAMGLGIAVGAVFAAWLLRTLLLRR